MSVKDIVKKGLKGILRRQRSAQSAVPRIVLVRRSEEQELNQVELADLFKRSETPRKKARHSFSANLTNSPRQGLPGARRHPLTPSEMLDQQISVKMASARARILDVTARSAGEASNV